MKSSLRILSITLAILFVGCRHAVDVLTPNTLLQFDNLQTFSAYKKQDAEGESLFIEAGILDSYHYLSKSQTSRIPVSGKYALVVSVYRSRTPDRGFARTPKGTFLKKVWTEAQIPDEKIFYKDDSGLHEVTIKKWNPDFS